MPVRFQVDADFYDHPKTIGMSADAFKLWVRAGSFSAAKLTDGFIAEDVLVHTLGTDKSVADELVRRRLWRRVRGGYEFHAWGERNLTKQRVQDDQKADRDRKRAKRQAEQEAARNAAGQKPKPQVEPQNVRPESERNPDGIQPESDRNPASSVSVSLSVSESVSGSGRDAAPGHPPSGEPPPNRCPEHLNHPNPPNCGPCKDAREVRDQWAREKARADQLARSTAAREHAEAQRLAIDVCHWCDHDGRRNGYPCNHTDLNAVKQRSARGAAAAQAALERERAADIATARQPGGGLAALDAALAETVTAQQEQT